jgi:hypothetical protein
VSTMVNNVPVVLTGIPYGKCRLNDLSQQRPELLQEMVRRWNHWAREHQVLPKPGAQPKTDFPVEE